MNNRHFATPLPLSAHANDQGVRLSAAEVSLATTRPFDTGIDDQEDVVTQPAPLPDSPVEGRFHDAMRVLSDLHHAHFGRSGFAGL